MLDVGDINFDGKIDMEDYNILAQYTAEGVGAEDLPLNKANWTPSAKQLAVMNCRTDDEWHRQNINVDDAVILYNYIHNIGDIVDLGVVPWTVDTNDYYDESNNVTNLLIIDGHYDPSVNIPFNEFTTDPWVIHDKFFNYLFGMAIHKYSTTEDITYVQKLLNAIYQDELLDKDYFTVGVYNDKVKQLLKRYQNNQIHYTTGDLNKDNKVDNKDVEIMKQYVEDSADYNKVCKYLIDPIQYPLTPAEILELDRDGDRIITENDKKIIQNELNRVYSPSLKDRADIDGNELVETKDYEYLKDIVENGHTYIERTSKKSDGSIVTTYQYCDLKNYDITFQLGWFDVQTESIIEFDINMYGDISEVTK